MKKTREGPCFVHDCKADTVRTWVVLEDRVWWSCSRHEPAIPSIGPFTEDELAVFQVLRS